MLGEFNILNVGQQEMPINDTLRNIVSILMGYYVLLQANLR